MIRVRGTRKKPTVGELGEHDEKATDSDDVQTDDEREVVTSSVRAEDSESDSGKSAMTAPAPAKPQRKWARPEVKLTDSETVAFAVGERVIVSYLPKNIFSSGSVWKGVITAADPNGTYTVSMPDLSTMEPGINRNGCRKLTTQARQVTSVACVR